MTEEKKEVVEETKPEVQEEPIPIMEEEPVSEQKPEEDKPEEAIKAEKEEKSDSAEEVETETSTDKEPEAKEKKEPAKKKEKQKEEEIEVVRLEDLVEEKEYSDEEFDFLTQMYDKTLHEIKQGDIVKGKSNGVIICSMGLPGVGKTLTAEVYSEKIKRPLYTVQASQLGLSREKS